MSDVYYARPITVTDERVQEAQEKAAKQRALREALDSQIYSRGGDQKSSGMTRAQQKRQELMHLQAERESQQQLQLQSPIQYQSNSLPPNFSMASSLSMHQGQQSNLTRATPGSYESNSVPAGYVVNNNSMHSPMILQQQQQQQRSQLHHPNFSLAEVYAQQQMNGGLHAPSNELSVPLSPRFVGNPSPHEPQHPPTGGAGSQYHKQLTTSDMLRVPSQHPLPQGWAGNGGGAEGVHNILRMAQRVTDNPASPLTAGDPYRQSNDVDAKQQRGGAGPSNVRATPGGKRDKSRERVVETRVEQLQKELQTRQNEMQKMRDKERNWEDQVKQLKMELKNARQKERDLNKMVLDKPQRAETAPNTGSISKLAPIGTVDRPTGRIAERPTVGQGTRASVGQMPQQVNVPGRKDFNNARVFPNDTFRPITAPLEPIDDVVRSSGHQQLPPLPDSLKLASFNTRKIAFGLAQASEAAFTLTYQQLCDFVKSQVVTQAQADALWRLFGGEPPKRPSPPPGSRPRDPSRRTVPSSPTYETYDDLNDEEEGDDPNYDDYDQ